ncbi:hypothetical protein TREMEDRAFT_59499 [Tremella mesenterica DSM 1558]|uniref:uncharacterized protein n=1 Tax=Tremella mesenterica (strain ATCC 24925 / CBS 8224 / DSM 1558 / NBRC 9311 / NRRL Y-6157 / RJB 2259-6 / UBC 559-6) TaxID=578456 RepID=UPI0003F4A26E|nr:uncharacterized protein TREMEDRAFT_59499 [Tremella mesenterica DSM 1558]EIW73332.1 hypothetical protein TREMEDRAFT_59499 [Tremella mesenterica DSM 1558]
MFSSWQQTTENTVRPIARISNLIQEDAEFQDQIHTILEASIQGTDGFCEVTHAFTNSDFTIMTNYFHIHSEDLPAGHPIVWSQRFGSFTMADGEEVIALQSRIETAVRNQYVEHLGEELDKLQSSHNTIQSDDDFTVASRMSNDYIQGTRALLLQCRRPSGEDISFDLSVPSQTNTYDPLQELNQAHQTDVEADKIFSSGRMARHRTVLDVGACLRGNTPREVHLNDDDGMHWMSSDFSFLTCCDHTHPFSHPKFWAMSLPPDNIHKWLIDPKYWPEVFYIPAASQKSTEPLTLQLYTSPPQQTSRRSLNFTIVPSSPISLSEDSNPSDEILFNPSTSRSVASRGWSPNNYQGPTSHFDENYSTSTRPDVWPWPTTNTGPDPITENVGTSDDLYSDFSTPNPSSTRRRSSVRRSSRDYDTDSDEKIDNARYTNWPWLRKKDDNTNPAESEEIYEVKEAPGLISFKSDGLIRVEHNGCKTRSFGNCKAKLVGHTVLIVMITAESRDQDMHDTCARPVGFQVTCVRQVFALSELGTRNVESEDSTMGWSHRTLGWLATPKPTPQGET